MEKEKVIVIVGPTAIGKTDLSIQLAKELQTEIISGDSMQVYKGMDIGTGKITKEEFDLAEDVCSKLLEEIQTNRNIFINMDKKELIKRYFR